MEEETQFVPFVIHIAASDAAWLAAWAPDPRALGAHAMGLAALRGLLAEDMPRGQPLGGEIQHARALIENARAVGDDNLIETQLMDFRKRIMALERGRALDAHRVENALRYIEKMKKNVNALEARADERANALLDAEVRAARVVDTEPTVRTFDLDGSEMFAQPRHDAASRIAALENRCSLLENDAESAAGRIAALEAKS